jgi:hypothetical protein
MVLQQKALGMWQEVLNRQTLAFTKANKLYDMNLMRDSVKKWRFKLKVLRKRRRTKLLEMHRQKSMNDSLKASFDFWRDLTTKKRVAMKCAVELAGNRSLDVAKHCFQIWMNRFVIYSDALDKALYSYRISNIR